MAKDYRITQTAMIKGQKRTASFILPFVDEAMLQNFCGLLEGGYEVVEVNTALSNMTKAETNVASSNPVKRITVRGEQKQVEYISAFGGKDIHFKNTVSGDDVRAIFTGKKIFSAVPAAGVTYVGFVDGESTIN